MCVTSLENLTAESLLTPPGVDRRDCIDDFRAGFTMCIGVLRGETRLGFTNLISISSSSELFLDNIKVVSVSGVMFTLFFVLHILDAGRVIVDQIHVLVS